MIYFLIVSHRYTYSLSNLYLVISIPNERFRLSSSSSSSVSDFLPKLRNFNRSFLLNLTSSPNVSTSPGLQAIQCANGKIHIRELALQQLTHVKHFFIEFLLPSVSTVSIAIFSSEEQHEMVNQNLSCFFYASFG